MAADAISRNNLSCSSLSPCYSLYSHRYHAWPYHSQCWTCWLYLNRTGSILCPVAAVLGYLNMRPPDPSPLFVCRDGSLLSRGYLIEGMRAALSQAGVDSSQCAGHSLRIGAATTAARAGFSDSFIQTLGRWKSFAFTTYIRTPPEDLMAIAARMAGL